MPERAPGFAPYGGETWRTYLYDYPPTPVGGQDWAALEDDGSLYTWGSNDSGQLGDEGAWVAEPVWIP